MTNSVPISMLNFRDSIEIMPESKLQAARELFNRFWPNAELEAWQIDPMARFFDFMVLPDEHNSRLYMMFIGAHGTGKSTIVEWFILLSIVLLETRGASFKGSIFSGKYDQLKTTIMADLRKWRDVSRIFEDILVEWGKIFLKSKEGISPNMICPKAWSLNDIQKIAGQHAEYSLIFIDEASAVPQELFDKLNGSTTDRRVLWICSGNSDKHSGFAHDLLYTNPGSWITYRIAHTMLTFRRNREFEAATIATYGADSDVYRMQVLGLPPRFDETAFVPWEYVERAMHRTPAPLIGAPLQMGVDVAGGEGADYSTILIRRGGEIVYCERKKCLLDETTKWVIDVCQVYGISCFAIDEVGIAMGVKQHLDRIFPGSVIGVNGCRRASNVSRFYNYRAELYSYARDWIATIGSIPNISKFKPLFKELAEIEMEFAGAQMRVKSKTATTGKSPDFTDALAYTFAVPFTARDPDERYLLGVHS